MGEKPPVYLAADLWMSLGLDGRQFDAYYETNGWAETWAALCYEVRVRSGHQLCLELTDENEPCQLLRHQIGPHMGASDVGRSPALPALEGYPEGNKNA